MSDSRLPITIITGVTGAGKTSVINHLLNQSPERNIAVVVNDASNVGVDAGWLREQHPELPKERIIELCGGSIDAESQEDLLIEIGRLAQEGGLDHVVVEACGVAEPLPVAEVFTLDLDGHGGSLSDIARLDALVTVVDAETFWVDFLSGETLKERQIAVERDDDRTTTDLVIEQVEFSDRIILNKTDRLEDAEIDRIEAMLRRLNTAAEVIRTQRGAVPPKALLDIRLFDMEKLNRLETWLALPGTEVLSETESMGVCNFIYRADRPFHPERLWEIIDEEWFGVCRSRGAVWLATRPEVAGFWSQAGDLMAVEWASWLRKDMSEEEWKALDPPFDIEEGEWETALGRPRQEIALVGINIDPKEISGILDRALLDDFEMSLGEKAWRDFPDPFPGSRYELY